MTFSVTVLSGTSHDAGASVSVNITRPNGAVSTLSGTTGSNGIAVLKYRLKKQDPAGTYSATASMTQSGSSTPVTASTSFAGQELLVRSTRSDLNEWVALGPLDPD